MKKSTKHLLRASAALVALEAGSLLYAGYKWEWGPFGKLHNVKSAHTPGNGPEYDLHRVGTGEDPILKGKKVLFLGSSVTFGAASMGVSFVDYIARKTGCIPVKEAVSGTTLVEEKEDSYVSRLHKVQETDIDILFCQLSTNDATQKKALGHVTDEEQRSDFDTRTVAGALEHIIAYSQEKWPGCQVMFYTNPKYDSREYEQMVETLKQVEEKWHTPIIDLWNDQKFNEISPEERKLFMADPIHPTKAGYLVWWTPYMLEKMTHKS